MKTAAPWPVHDEKHDPLDNGMTLRQYAAIKLKVPNSGTEWLDEMITKSLRDDFAAKAMQACVNKNGSYGWFNSDSDISYKISNTMLEARKK